MDLFGYVFQFDISVKMNASSECSGTQLDFVKFWLARTLAPVALLLFLLFLGRVTRLDYKRMVGNLTSSSPDTSAADADSARSLTL